MSKAVLPQAVRRDLVVARVVPGRWRKDVASFLRLLGGPKTPAHLNQFALPIVIQTNDGRQMFRENGVFRLRISEMILIRRYGKELAHRLLGGGVGVEVAHGQMKGDGCLVVKTPLSVPQMMVLIVFTMLTDLAIVAVIAEQLGARGVG